MNTIKLRYEQGKFRQEVYIGRHHLIVDEPIADGGEDMGPTPVEYLAAALASCTAITLRMYTQNKGWPLENAEISVSKEKVGDMTTFHSQIKLVGKLTNDQRQRLLEIATRCPIHKMLTGKADIKTILV